jgi:hypothetical protein
LIDLALERYADKKRNRVTQTVEESRP